MEELPIFTKVAPAVAYFKLHGLGAKIRFVRTVPKGVDKTTKWRVIFLERGVRVSVADDTVTAKEFTEARINAVRDYQGSRANPNTPNRISNAKSTIKPGETIYVEGNLNTIVRQARKYWGAGSYSLRKDGDGWKFTRLK